MREGSPQPVARGRAQAGRRRRLGRVPRRPSYDLDALDTLARRQDGLVTLAQLRALDIPGHRVGRWTGPRGPWQRLLPGIYAVTSGTPTDEQRVRAALLYAGPTAVLTGLTALRRHGLRRLPKAHDGLVHVLVPHARHRSSTGFVTVERTVRPAAPMTVRSAPTSSVARAVVDAARRLTDLSDVRALTAEALQTGRCNLGELWQELAAAQIRGTARLRAALREAGAGVRSPEEARALELFRSMGLDRVRWNVHLYDRETGRWLACVDAYDELSGNAFEVDSREFHLDPAGWEQTLLRHARLTARGVLVWHLTPRRLRDREELVEEIRSATDERRSTGVVPGPPPPWWPGR